MAKAECGLGCSGFVPGGRVYFHGGREIGYIVYLALTRLGKEQEVLVLMGGICNVLSGEQVVQGENCQALKY